MNGFMLNFWIKCEVDTNLTDYNKMEFNDTAISKWYGDILRIPLKSINQILYLDLEDLIPWNPYICSTMKSFLYRKMSEISLEHYPSSLDRFLFFYLLRKISQELSNRTNYIYGLRYNLKKDPIFYFDKIKQSNL